MIELDFTGICKGCDIGELEIKTAYYDSRGKKYASEYVVVCSHQDACARAIQKMKEGKC